jgi:arylsulfatase A-like enzyme
LLIQVDALRRDHLSVYGYERKTSPNLEKDWLAFEGLTTAASWTAPSTASLLTGLQPYRHGVQYAKQQAERVVNQPLHAPSLVEVFKAADYRTALITGNAYVGSDTGMNVGFDRTIFVNKQYPFSNLGQEQVQLETWLHEIPADAPFFAMMHAMDVHAPYYSPEGTEGTWSKGGMLTDLEDYAQQEELSALYAQDPDGTAAEVNALYDEEILGLDRAIQGMLEMLERSGRSDTLVVLIGDHGESLGERGQFGHGSSLEEEQVAVPFLIHHPELAGGRHSCLASNMDILPTLIRSLNLTLPEGLDGRPLQEGCLGTPTATLYDPQRDGILNMVASYGEAGHREYSCLSGRAGGHGETTEQEASHLDEEISFQVQENDLYLPGQRCTRRPE